jgi:hypothetical protein
MLDKNYKIEKGFLAEVPVRFRPGATSMLTIEPLHCILAWDEDLVSRYFKEKMPTGADKELVRSRLILSKITYFNPLTLDSASTQKLIKLAAQTLDFPHTDAQKIAELTSQAYPVFSAWILNAYKQSKQAKPQPKLVVKDSPDADIQWCR